ncbi:MAG: MFS transporter [Negativicutes bacterium]|nr:MFS transporter [Negativicutes bacterium]
MDIRRKVYLAMAVGCCWFSLFAYLPILPTYARDLGASYEMIGVIAGSYGLMQVLLRLPLGIMADKFNRRKIFISFGLVLCVLSGAGMWLIPGVVPLLFFRAVAGIAATAWVVHTVLYVSYYPPVDSAKAMGIVNAISVAGQMIGTLLGGWLAYRFGDEVTFLLATVGGVVGLVFSFAVADNRQMRRETLRVTDLLEVGKDGSLLLASLLALILQLVTYGTIYGFIPIAARAIGADNFQLGLLPTLFMLPGVCFSVLSGRIATWLGSRRAVITGFTIMAGAAAAVPFATSMATLYLSQIAAGLGWGLAFSLLMEYGINPVAENKRATAMGYLQAIYSVGMFVGPVLVGLLAGSVGLDWGFWAVGATGLAAAVISAIWLRPSDQCQHL